MDKLTAKVRDLSDRCAELRAKAKALRASAQALREQAEQNLAQVEDMRKVNQGQLEILKQMVRDHAKRNGVELPEAVVEDSSPASMAIRCQFYLAAHSEGYWECESEWLDRQEYWFAHPKFDAKEFERLCVLYNFTQEPGLKTRTAEMG